MRVWKLVIIYKMMKWLCKRKTKLRASILEVLILKLVQPLIKESLCRYWKFLWNKCKMIQSESWIEAFWVSNSQIEIRIEPEGTVSAEIVSKLSLSVLINLYYISSFLNHYNIWWLDAIRLNFCCETKMQIEMVYMRKTSRNVTLQCVSMDKKKRGEKDTCDINF